MDSKAICAEADELQHADKWREAYDVLKGHNDSDDAEVLWRLIRSYYRMGKFLAANRAEKDYMASTGNATVERAVSKYPDHFEVRKWSGIFISWSSDLGGNTEKIKQSFVIKEHFLAAIKLNGNDAIVKHLLGRWCYEVASVGWFTRKAAAALFGEPPNSSYEEALTYFEDSERTAPDSYSGNWLFLGKTYQKLGNRAEAKKYFTKLVESKPSNPEEREYQQEAEGLIKKV